MIHDPPRPPFVAASPAAADPDPILTLPPFRRASPLAGAAEPAGAAAVCSPASAPAEPPFQPSGVLAELAALRAEQVEKWGHTPEKDALLPIEALPKAAAVALTKAASDATRGGIDYAQFNKPAQARRYLLKAGALIVAAIIRLDAEPADDWPELGE